MIKSRIKRKRRTKQPRTGDLALNLSLALTLLPNLNHHLNPSLALTFLDDFVWKCIEQRGRVFAREVN